MRILAMLVLACTLSDCASVTRGWTNQIQFNSSPPEAAVRTSLGHSCTTPCTLQFNRKDQFTVTFTKPGFHTEQVMVRTQLAGAGAAGVAGNVILGGVIGMGVDVASGAALEHCPNPVAVVLRPVAVPVAPARRNARTPIVAAAPPAPELLPTDYAAHCQPPHDPNAIKDHERAARERIG
jgi:hypothetical protein